MSCRKVAQEMTLAVILALNPCLHRLLCVKAGPGCLDVCMCMLEAQAGLIQSCAVVWEEVKAGGIKQRHYGACIDSFSEYLAGTCGFQVYSVVCLRESKEMFCNSAWEGGIARFTRGLTECLDLVSVMAQLAIRPWLAANV